MRAPLEHLTQTEKLALIHSDSSFQSVGGGLSHWGKVVRQEIFSVDEEVKEPFAAGIWREFCFEFPSEPIFHHRDWEGVLHVFSFEYLGALQL